MVWEGPFDAGCFGYRMLIGKALAGNGTRNWVSCWGELNRHLKSWLSREQGDSETRCPMPQAEGRRETLGAAAEETGERGLLVLRPVSWTQRRGIGGWREKGGGARGWRGALRGD